MLETSRISKSRNAEYKWTRNLLRRKELSKLISRSNEMVFCKIRTCQMYQWPPWKEFLTKPNLLTIKSANKNSKELSQKMKLMTLNLQEQNWSRKFICLSRNKSLMKWSSSRISRVSLKAKSNSSINFRIRSCKSNA